jgi:competence protein ComFC
MLNIHTNFFCPNCNTKISSLNQKHNCNLNIYNFKFVIYCMDYKNDIVKSLIHKFKYQKISCITPTIKQILSTSLNKHKPYFKHNNYIVIPVPLHKYKQRSRGFNQSEIISNIISQILNIKTYNNVLIRFKNNPPQANQTDILKRQENAKNIFKINENQKHLIQNKNIILVDDVFTTGSTLNECAKILKQNKANNIICICLAK